MGLTGLYEYSVRANGRHVMCTFDATHAALSARAHHAHGATVQVFENGREYFPAMDLDSDHQCDYFCPGFKRPRQTFREDGPLY